MRQATRLWTLWQALLKPFAAAFTRLGYRRFVEWITALALSLSSARPTGKRWNPSPNTVPGALMT